MAGKRKKSTTRSATNLESLSLYTFFLDRALESYVLRDALKALGGRVQMHRDHFREDAEDVDWLPVIARREWVILSKDQFNWLERRAIRNAKGRAFLLVRGELSGQEQASIICKALPKMLRILDLTPQPFMAKIYRDSSVLTMKLD
jgi:predicted nuclease of predicted toxin-antitoxin system